jgi:hypothetical protein
MIQAYHVHTWSSSFSLSVASLFLAWPLSVLTPALPQAKQACMYVPVYIGMDPWHGGERRVCERARPLANEPLNNVAPMTATRPEGT